MYILIYRIGAILICHLATRRRMQKEFRSTNSITILRHHRHHCFSARDYLYEKMSTRLSLPFYCCPVFIAIVNGTCFWIDGTEALNWFTCYDLNNQCVAIVKLAQPLINLLTAFAHIISRQVFKACTMADNLFGEIRAQILGGKIQPAWPWHHVCEFYVVYDLQSLVLLLSKS